MPPNPYTLARRLARRRMLALDAATQRRIVALLAAYAEQLGAMLSGLPPGRQAALQASEDAILFLTRRLEQEMIRMGEDARSLSFRVTREMWLEASERIATAEGVSRAALGAVRAPPVTFLGAFEMLGEERSWKTVVAAHARNAGREVQHLIAQGIAEQVDTDELARRVRRYMVGSEGLQAFEDGGKIDLRKVPEAYRGAARQMAYNAERLVVTEVHSARHEAEVGHLYHDPFVRANRWELSPDRGTARVPDGCDFIARADYYGLGPGIYPVHATPSLVHPWDRCEIVPVTRSSRDLAKAKPAPGRKRSPQGVTVPDLDRLSETAARRAREDALKAILVGESATQTVLRRAA